MFWHEMIIKSLLANILSYVRSYWNEPKVHNRRGNVMTMFEKFSKPLLSRYIVFATGIWVRRHLFLLPTC